MQVTVNIASKKTKNPFKLRKMLSCRKESCMSLIVFFLTTFNNKYKNKFENFVYACFFFALISCIHNPSTLIFLDCLPSDLLFKIIYFSVEFPTE